MMRQRNPYAYVMAFLCAMLVACAGAPTATPNDQAALCIQGVTTARKAATALLRAGKITVEKDRALQASLDEAVPGCRLLATTGAPT